ncbi:threonine ammonia-lyase IlvA [Enterococcus bulliens]
MEVVKTNQSVSKQTIEAAYQTLQHVVTKTPLQYDRYLSERYACKVYLKREDLQKVRSFKLRGAYYAITQQERAIIERGVVCASAGNHAQGVAYTCQELTIPGVIFMPTPTPQQKINQVQFFGGGMVDIRLVGDTFDEAAQAAKVYATVNGLPFIAPFDDQAIISGQGTVALEIMQQAIQQELTIDYVLAAIGGGGLLSGVGVYTKAKSPNTHVIGVEPEGAPSMAAALAQNGPVTLEQLDKFVDGAAVQRVGELTYQYVKQTTDAVYTVPEGEICQTILDLYSKQAIVVEPAGALSVAALEQMKEQIKGKTVVCVISGGNNDISRMEEIEERALIYQGLKHYFLVNFPQRPGALKEFVTKVLGPDDDITRFEYTKKVNRRTGPVVLGIQLKEAQAIESLLERLTAFDSTFIDLSKHPSLYTLLV